MCLYNYVYFEMIRIRRSETLWTDLFQICTVNTLPGYIRFQHKIALKDFDFAWY